MAAVSRWPDSKGGSHILGYADDAGRHHRQRHVRHARRNPRSLEALRQAGAEFIIFAMAGGREHLRRFAREIMPGFSSSARAGGNAAPSEHTPA